MKKKEEASEKKNWSEPKIFSLSIKNTNTGTPYDHKESTADSGRNS